MIMKGKYKKVWPLCKHIFMTDNLVEKMIIIQVQYERKLFCVLRKNRKCISVKQSKECFLFCLGLVFHLFAFLKHKTCNLFYNNSTTNENITMVHASCSYLCTSVRVHIFHGNEVLRIPSQGQPFFKTAFP